MLNQLEKVQLLKAIRTREFGECHIDKILPGYSNDTLVEVQEFFIDYLYKQLSGEKKNGEKFLSKLSYFINSITSEFCYREYQISDELYNRLTGMKQVFEEYVARNNLRVGEDLEHLIEDMGRLCTRNVVTCTTPDTIVESEEQEIDPPKPEDSNIEEEVESEVDENRDRAMLKYKKTIERLRNERQALNERCEQLATDIQNLETIANTRTEEHEQLVSEVSSLKKDLQAAKETAIKIGLENQKLTSKYSQLTSEYNHVVKVNAATEKENRELTERMSIFDKLSDENKRYMENENARKRELELEKKIIKFLTGNIATIEQIKAYIETSFGEIEVGEIYHALEAIGHYIPITNPDEITWPRLYSITSQNYMRDQRFTIGLASKQRHIDILATADYHIGDDRVETLPALDAVYEYAASNGIPLILNLGDVFHLDNYDDAGKVQELSELVKKNMPYDANIHQAILGGNHDRHGFKYGIDLIGELTRDREDLIDIGYDRAVVNFSGIKDSIILCHLPLKDIIKGSVFQESDKNSDYAKSPYITLGGHVHKSIINIADAYAVVPSLSKDHYQNGAYHLRINFDHGNITSIIISTLEYTEKLHKTNEIVYKKIPKKK